MNVQYTDKVVLNLLKNYYTLMEQAYMLCNFDVIDMLNDIDLAIKNLSFTNSQTRNLRMFMTGMNYSEIARANNQKRNNVLVSITNIADKIVWYLNNDEPKLLRNEKKHESEKPMTK